MLNDIELKNEEQKVEENDKKQKQTRKRIWTIVIIVILVLLLALICVEIAYISDFFIYKDSGKNGLLWTVEQRKYGLFWYF
ncbi:hypothetical protein C4M96_03605 [Mycoplasmopsis pullorum]|uniref:hypothetical protein n=1 Tax=Mycoplasmopsis pullorum TaxID=48003 RepID=UPI001119E9B1|nr:hypothetical protein [Mycoplasmopsis pullorum]TNK82315.1 hypothetical protein C4M93_03880 [Mycoplasmopsis pullorum]TNK91725.1 hypothetical protein C4M96_03605 [Mycoplasmopsis pullorum]